MRRALTVLTLVGVVALAGCAGTPFGGALDGATSDDGGIDPDEDIDSGENWTEAPATAEGTLEIHHIDVGQADATLLVTPANETVLIDTGDWRDDGAAVIDYLEAEGIDRIDHLVATHAHADHVGGHAAVIEWAETEGDGVGAAYDSGVPSDSATYGRYLDAVEEHDVDLFVVEAGDALPLAGDAAALALGPPGGDSGSDLHANTLALAVRFGEFRYLTTGDAEVDAETRLLGRWDGELAADVYQAGHHGSATSSSAAFLDAVDPGFAVVSSGYDSRYGHPSDAVLERFAARGIETYWTGVHGDVVVTTNGTGVGVETSEAFSTDPEALIAAKPDDDVAAAVLGLRARPALARGLT